MSRQYPSEFLWIRTDAIPLIHNSQHEVCVQYIAIALPCFGKADILDSHGIGDEHSKARTIDSGCRMLNSEYRNATSAVMSLFGGGDAKVMREAMRVILVYGVLEAVSIGLYLLVFWRLGWTKAPQNENCFTMIAKSYEEELVREKDGIDNSEGIDRLECVNEEGLLLT
eukprot:scaffold2569_cov197-Alexandrium_tamarense.AAC.31